MNKQFLSIEMTMFKNDDHPGLECSIIGIALNSSDLHSPLATIVGVTSEGGKATNVTIHGLIPMKLYRSDLKKIKNDLVDWEIDRPKVETKAIFGEDQDKIYNAFSKLMGKDKTVEVFELLGLTFNAVKAEERQTLIKTLDEQAQRYNDFGDWS